MDDILSLVTTDQRPASWRGIPFAITNATIKAYRNTAVHSYFGKDDPWIEDISAAPLQISVSGYIAMGFFATWAAQKNLIKACRDLKGPGTLVHPNAGAFNVCLINASIAQDYQNVGRLNIQFEFIYTQQTSEKQFEPTLLTNTQSVINSITNAVEDALNSDFVQGVMNVYSTGQEIVSAAVNVVGGVIGIATSIVHDATSAINSVKGLGMILSDEFTCGRYNQGNIDSVPLSLSTVSMTLTTARLAEAATVAMVSAATNNAAEVDLLGSNLVTIAGQIVATEPSCTSFTNALISLNDTIQATVNDPADQIRLISQLAAYTSDSPYAGSSIVLSVIRRSALVELAKAIAEYNFTSSTDAEAMMEQVIPLFDAEIEIAADNYDNSTYRALKRLRTAVVDDLQTRGSQLPELYDVSFNTSLPVSKIAYMLYQDATRTDEITIRNNPIHPLFMQNTLEVLSY